MTEVILARVSRKWSLAEGIAAFELRELGGRELPAFTAGAHVDVHVADGVVRQYSLTNDQGERDRYVIAVKRLDEGRGGSRALHEQVGEGAVLRIGAPVNHFELHGDERPAVLVGGGIGITPLLPMARRLRQRRARFALHYVAAGPDHVIFRERLAAGEFGDDVRVCHGRDRFDAAAIATGSPPNARVYVCGPIQLMDAVRAAFAIRGDADVHMEYFVAPAEAPPALAAGEFAIALGPGAPPLAIGADVSIVDALRGLGLSPDTSCEQGVCGTCITRVFAGQIDHRDYVLTEAERRAGDRMAICVSRGCPGTTLVLDFPTQG